MRRWSGTARNPAKLLALLFGVAGAAGATGPKPESLHAFEKYLANCEARMQNEVEPGGAFLWIDSLTSARREEAKQSLLRGEIVEQPRETEDSSRAFASPGALIHDWVGTVFIRGASLDQVLSLVQDYDRHEQYFAPQVDRSKLLRREGDRFEVYLRLKQTKVITVVFDTDHEVQYTRLDAHRAYSRSYSTSIREVENPGERDERDPPAGEDHGFLWRLDSYWRFSAADGGVYVQCEAISLTRDVPVGLGWLIRPFLESIPRESLEFTLRSTRAAVMAR